MATELEKGELWSAIDRYAAMQEEHLAALRRGRLRGAMQWRVERERAFVVLRRLLEVLGDSALLADRQFAARLTEKIGALLATENLLQKAVGDSRERIGQQQAGLRKGQNVVRRLSSRPEAGGARPRFVSSVA